MTLVLAFACAHLQTARGWCPDRDIDLVAEEGRLVPADLDLLDGSL
eukprot:CAMPEP_0196663542 /NCGR_PEP_ID=MMETSP1086-20130531/53314_1 /TAXON_ID=77921 /ORGANISM="Cyanoptyche  gloeocystis , Strain SAG4.97" /LENGTH=45 /DNA_ID= /DNA_START= /DNA_END= /DNA_ORIENTATION=